MSSTQGDVERARAEKAAQEAEMEKEGDEIEACHLFFNATGGGDHWSTKWGWFDKDETITKYSGIRVDHTGKIVEIMLPFNGLDSSPKANPQGNNWGEALNGLRFLQSLNIHGNQLEGSLEDVMEAACKMTRSDQFLKRPFHFESLRNIDICRNKMSGPFPECLCEVPTLEWINFSRNALTGPVPDNVSKLKALKLLDLSCNKLNGSLPTRGLRTLSKLQCLNLGNNTICGKISNDLSRLTSLVVLNLSSNQFTGKIPSQVSCLTSIKKLDLHSNSLSGCIESDLFDGLANLVNLVLSDNMLTGPIPDSASNLFYLRTMKINRNSFTGVLPVTILSEMSANLRMIDISDNLMAVSEVDVRRLKGSFPDYFQIVYDKQPDDSYQKGDRMAKTESELDEGFDQGGEEEGEEEEEEEEGEKGGEEDVAEN